MSKSSVTLALDHARWLILEIIYSLQAGSTTVAGGFRLLIAFLSVIVCTDWHAEACVAIGLNGDRTVNLILATKQTYKASTRVHVIWDSLNICLTLTLALLLPAWSVLGLH